MEQPNQIHRGGEGHPGSEIGDPPDGFGSQVPFKQLPSYMQDIIRREWSALTSTQREAVRANLEAWVNSDRRPEFEGPVVIGDKPAGESKNARKKGGTRKSFGAFGTTIEDID